MLILLLYNIEEAFNDQRVENNFLDIELFLKERDTTTLFRVIALDTGITFFVSLFPNFPAKFSGFNWKVSPFLRFVNFNRTPGPVTNCVTASFTIGCCRIEAINKRNDVSSCRRTENWKWKVGNKFPPPPPPPPLTPPSLVHPLAHPSNESFPHCCSGCFYQFPSLVTLFPQIALIHASNNLTSISLCQSHLFCFVPPLINNLLQSAGLIETMHEGTIFRVSVLKE